MRTVICHFYNEEYLLPFWLRHHRNLFDYGIMINHRSDDNSVNIIKELTPHWLIVDTKLKWFAADENDIEVMDYEKSIIDWKMVLNVTEFLLPAISMDEIQNYLINNKLSMGKAKGYIIVDENIVNKPKLKESLPLQKHYGCVDSYGGRNRIFHGREHGNYHLGRHGTRYGSINLIPNLFLFYYEYAPWTEPYIKRKLQIQSRIPGSDRMKGRGCQHFFDMITHNKMLQDRLKKAHNLAEHPEIKLALDMIITYT